MPRITIYPQASPVKNHSFRCDINEGPGHHGTGSSEAEALLNAARAWLIYEEKKVG